MSFSSFPVNDNVGTSHAFGTKSFSSREFAGHLDKASDEGGWLPYRNIDLGTTGQVVKASAGRLRRIHASNGNASARFLKVYNMATAPAQTDTPIFTYRLLQGATPIEVDVDFSTGISLRASTGVADNDTGAPSSNDVIVAVSYY